MMAPKTAVVVRGVFALHIALLLRVLAYSLGTFTDSMLGKFTGQKQFHGSLDFTR